MKHATLRQLKVFEAVARLLSFSRAAEELHLTQPAVSTQVRKLEEHAGNALFEQFGKKVYLTAAGSELLQISRAIIQQFEAAENAMMQFKGVSGGKLNVGVISAGDYFFPRLLVEFASRHQGVTLNFTVHNRAGLLTHIAENLTDLAIMVRPPTDLDTVNQPFAPHPYVIVAAPGHPLVGEKRIAVQRLMREPFVVREKASDTWHSMEDGFGGDLSGINIAMEIRSTETIKQAVIAGMGVSFVSAHTVSQELRAGSLRVLDVEGFPLMLNWYVVHRRSKRLPPVAQAFKDFLLSDGPSLISQIVPFEG
ncbi:LysR family transcriptional regulator [Variovorax sp. NFACC27]|jgi:DNA-binding transcriptional LysR family regulator|uniref:LysR family transcriptional regulator n=1 Tax=Variovorax gossypii TaxID=1679495 RepID=A0A431TKW5_9BURK|nr:MULTISPECIES: LysR family transcriptional regulator [Variovorax]MDP9605916.1 DNA-binding transcriptional LysR family regulator [Variovorax paradoxus]SEF29344.1 DNA-binding transcriptional regulator, LysR family [Variovorax sp. NFACC28]SEG92913.1 DNA-binding transcriptional regulator, LysR family [Variovorax sp. NFACC29]SFD67675.1 DNA-binding transcriptional regulator, LysR family [Variovorax sp. NFACC26]SFH11264.1 DNA-binding transcriptional regulator, LysR family [Variovorax sp. NFACC27]